MKKREQILIMVIIFLLMILLLPTISKAAMAIKPDETVWTNISVSDAFDRCRELAYHSSTLGNNNLDPHLTLNSDWGAVAFLTMSVYGVNDVDSGKTSTTGNETGVKDFGKTYTWTAAAHITGLESALNALIYRQSLITNKSSKYVELLKDKIDENEKGLALNVAAGGKYCTSDMPALIRVGLLGCSRGNNVVVSNYGGPARDITLRPVIWNK